ncbi:MULTISPECIES: DUF1641 domain-containing protein [Aneurinibacillus]|uniref:DUF1641 domain-containing protein n=1 Tax=Aneurinibacillus thermoaerophilus TaxID=143495 RepID=A0A1G7Y1X8_ANETH|nr:MULTISPECIES: DUF1641 domain-containing protein [Aneurinibacillus]AMA72964.1 hypothetical protein ACH33_08885 [Aneurinibacillus sp. XH2]MED0675905.1 DUF1641 domain-containing protein [Aneurinibacillus thermoaerophilus]MED0677820.1 DUF1641 domain-containing protein [Aneurinibacillus thermoaerophilus]MED0737569.1 DUF1641 domain-containing protein [Aneurinibacillus thermoaerophilus]MED0758140.1 DUF1641 domain-containing protein [Aneurinibacillus thermoaerophilus]
MDTEIKQQNLKQDSALWINELSNPEVQEALAMLIQKLPQVKEAIVKVEQGVEVVSAFASDTDSINYLAERVDRFSKLALNKENMEALAVMIESLPRIAKCVTLLDRLFSTIEPLITDKESLAYLADTVKLVTTPVTERVQEGVSIVKEAKERAAQNQTNISIFGLLKLLKDPTVQDGLKFVQALLEVLSEKKVVK